MEYEGFNQLPFKAKRWLEAVDAYGTWRPVLLSVLLQASSRHLRAFSRVLIGRSWLFVGKREMRMMRMMMRRRMMTIKDEDEDDEG